MYCSTVRAMEKCVCVSHCSFKGTRINCAHAFGSNDKNHLSVVTRSISSNLHSLQSWGYCRDNGLMDLLLFHTKSHQA